MGFWLLRLDFCFVFCLGVFMVWLGFGCSIEVFGGREEGIEL